MKKFLYIFIALNLLGVGINFVLQVGFGCDAITMMNDGIARFFQTNYTISGLIYSTICMVIAVVFAKDLLGWGSVSYAYATGIFIDVYRWILAPLEIAELSTTLKILLFVVGQLMMCYAFAMLIALNLGRSPLDAILASIEKKLHISYRVVKTICDVIFVIVAYLLGSTFGIGTILCVLTTGYCIQFFCKMMNRKQVKSDSF